MADYSGAQKQQQQAASAADGSGKKKKVTAAQLRAQKGMKCISQLDRVQTVADMPCTRYYGVVVTINNEDAFP